MKKFTAADIGKTFKTSQEGVTAIILDYDISDNTIRVDYSNGELDVWLDNSGESLTAYPTIYPDQPIPSEADLLRKEIDELKAKHEADLRTAIEMARTSNVVGANFSWYTPDEIINKILNNHGNT